MATLSPALIEQSRRDDYLLAATQVKYHQDFLLESHTNDDLMTLVFFLDDVTEQNGSLEVIPGSHREPLYEHWHHVLF